MSNGDQIVLLVLDADGVMTDGRIIIDDAGDHVRAFDVQDGMAVRLWHEAGGQVAIVTGRVCGAVAHRAADLKIDHVRQGSSDKVAVLYSLLAELGLSTSQACFIGDDLPDALVMQRCGYSVAVANAVAEVKAVADYVTTCGGGRGAVREAVEHLLRRDGRWSKVVAGYGVQAS